MLPKNDTCHSLGTYAQIVAPPSCFEKTVEPRVAILPYSSLRGPLLLVARLGSAAQVVLLHSTEGASECPRAVEGRSTSL